MPTNSSRLVKGDDHVQVAVAVKVHVNVAVAVKVHVNVNQSRDRSQRSCGWVRTVDGDTADNSRTVMGQRAGAMTYDPATSAACGSEAEEVDAGSSACPNLHCVLHSAGLTSVPRNCVDCSIDHEAAIAQCSNRM